MANSPKFTRPAFGESLKAWQAVLSERGLPTDLLWVFDENLCFEEDPASKDKFKLGFQTRFTPPPPDAGQIAYDHFCEFQAPIVFYRIGSCGGKSLCLLLCDDWFRPKGEKDGFIRRDDWLIAFRPGGPEKIEEIADEARWKRRILKNRPLHDMDFCMPLQAIHEILAHGRVLTAYEHYALRFLDAWRRLITPAE
jgi:hypothetical protein